MSVSPGLRHGRYPGVPYAMSSTPTGLRPGKEVIMPQSLSSVQDEYRAFLRKHGMEWDERFGWERRNPVGVLGIGNFPRVAALPQPWARRQNPVGIPATAISAHFLTPHFFMPGSSGLYLRLLVCCMSFNL